MIDLVQRRVPRLIALSPHDSSQWTLSRFSMAFVECYQTIRVGEEIVAGTGSRAEKLSSPARPETVPT